MATWKWVTSWHSILLNALSTQYQCMAIIVRVGDARVGRVYGRRADLDTVKFQYAYFVLEITRLMERGRSGRGKSWGNSFCLGAVSAVIAAMKEATIEVRAQAQAWALVRVDGRLRRAQAALRAAFPRVGKGSAGRPILNSDGYEAGKRAGAGLSQRSQVGQGGTKLLGTG